ncbi:MAG TPA: 2-oxoacid:ferredoxin oxidoreductase subunit beta, partial [Alphaproteobacteria bacterium]|nr:2-oxoacid:ferredoxin oxidoreductase subunit beta [Alphaproteobacteria bacterium]
LATLLVSLEPPAFPVALGVLYCDPAPSFEASVHEQIAAQREKKPAGGLNALLRQGYTWTVAG